MMRNIEYSKSTFKYKTLPTKILAPKKTHLLNELMHAVKLNYGFKNMINVCYIDIFSES